MQEENQNSRRKFFKLGIKLSALAAIGPYAVAKALKGGSSSGETVQLMSTD
ncbi:MAG: hypothetical protein HYU68_04145, partial [Bacteroidetes bacterium]|nr:hypothetical protein [Bacteroidota bacterium]